MNFGELRFWSALFSFLAVIFLLRWPFSRMWPASLGHFDRTALSLLGISLLLVVSWETVVIFLLVLTTTYLGLRWIMRTSRPSKHWLWALVPLQLAPLLYYKYGKFVSAEVLGVRWTAVEGLIIPVGISFYTFQLIGFSIDTLVGKNALPSFLNTLNFIGFFPQLVAGPIERRSNLLPQVETFTFQKHISGLNEGSSWIVLGLFYKCCLADNLATFFQPNEMSPLSIWKNNLLFGFRIYFDFAGYSLIAFGLGKCLGIDLTLNFTSPYCSKTITEFWRRWHITLSNWFRDYVYFPLGGGRVRWWALNVFVVFIVSGIWHGAGWNFIIWGFLHGIFLVAHRLLGRFRWPAFAGPFLTLLIVFYSWLCFYETRPPVLASKLQIISNPLNYSVTQLVDAVRSIRDPNTYVSVCFIILSGIALLLEWYSLRKAKTAYHYLRILPVSAILIVLTLWLAPGKTNDFIYFAF